MQGNIIEILLLYLLKTNVQFEVTMSNFQKYLNYYSVQPKVVSIFMESYNKF